MPDVAQRRLIVFVVGASLLGGAVGAVLASVLDSDSSNTAALATHTTTTTTTATTTVTTVAPTTVAPPTPTTAAAGPPCTSAAILAALQQSGDTVTSVAGVACGNGWAGASVERTQAAGAALLKAQGDHWVVANRAQDCNDPSIPPPVHFYCTVS
jgi:hypothetical protein